MNITEGKVSILCDSCREKMDPKLDVDKEHIKAQLSNLEGKDQEYTFCGERCLLDFLKKRDKTKPKKKKSKASYSFNSRNRVLEIDLGV